VARNGAAEDALSKQTALGDPKERQESQAVGGGGIPPFKKRRVGHPRFLSKNVKNPKRSAEVESRPSKNEGWGNRHPAVEKKTTRHWYLQASIIVAAIHRPFIGHHSIN
jgi:hypothetical protein